MALIPCPSCGHQISSFASACPRCGCHPGKFRVRQAVPRIKSEWADVMPFIAAIFGTICFAMSLYLSDIHMTMSANEILPYCLLFATVGVALSWASACTYLRVLYLVSAGCYLVAAAIMLFFSLFCAFPFLIPSALFVLSFFMSKED